VYYRVIGKRDLPRREKQMATIWESRIDSDDFDLEHLTKEQLEELADQLDTVVMAICQDWGLGQ